MILDKIENAELYYDCVPGLKRVLQFYNDNDLEEFPPCKIRLDADNLFINIDEIQQRDEKQIPLESHRDYIDIQIPLTSTERMGWRPQVDCQSISKEYDEGKDVEFYKDKPLTTISVPKGYFVVFFPSDAHQPGLIDEVSHRKIVAKVLVRESR